MQGFGFRIEGPHPVGSEGCDEGRLVFCEPVDTDALREEDGLDPHVGRCACAWLRGEGSAIQEQLLHCNEKQFSYVRLVDVLYHSTLGRE